ncbi:peptidoglycan-binding protein [Spongiactinospora sp. 9N601]|uniref:peptidoglycan-binding protein n=1 Tax=Spongiactinospora sp. 9N601 TaxID=3375149 RepID=UPI003790A9C8
MTAPPFQEELEYPPTMTGQAVDQWQRQMRKRGWHIATDGEFGHEDRRLCANFQMEHGLEATGTVDKKTWKATWEATSTDAPPPPSDLPLEQGDSGPSVRRWQRQVNNRGWPDLEVDSQFGPKTKQATKELQKFRGLEVTGIVDHETWKAAWEENAPVHAGV